MDFLNKLKNAANKTYQSASQKTGELAKEAKLKMKMNENRAKIKDLYEEIGKIIYQKHIHGEEVKIKEDLDTYCSQIDEISKEQEKLQEEVLTLKNKRICENCYAEIELKSRYCPHCGFEQPEEKKEDINEDKIDDKNTVEIVEEDKKKKK